MPTYKQYRRSQVAEMTDWEPGFDMTGVSVSAPDTAAGSPKPGDKIARALGLRRSTVEHHLRALRRMHGAATTLELACIVWTQRCAELDARLSRSQATLAVLDRRRRE